MAQVGEFHVVVVGSGLAGLTCARRLAESGQGVTVVTASRRGRDGATHRVHGLAPWILLSAPWVRGDSPRRFLEDLRQRSGGLARTGLDEVFAEQAHPAARTLAEELDLEALDEGPVLLPGDEMPRGRRFLPRQHRPLLEPLVRRCEGLGVTFREREVVVGLLMSRYRATGVVTLRRGQGDRAVLPADAVVLACGGAGAVFPCSTSPRWCCGSGLALAEVSGTLLHHPHLTQALPVTATPPLFFPTSAALVNGRLRVGGIVQERAAGLPEATAMVAEALRRGVTVELLPPVVENGSVPPRVKASPALRRPGALPLRLALHHSVGGVAIDVWGRTSTPGLYACGEAAGGVQGGRRTMGTGLLEAFIFGQRAAAAVARDVARLAPAPGTTAEVLVAEPADPVRLGGVLDRLLDPLTEIRPVEEVGQALAQLEAWPRGAGVAGEEGAQVALRLEAALVLLRAAAAGGRETA
ncbi:MAG: FAD-dependent oxidoreductase [Acidobacteriota bacterium]